MKLLTLVTNNATAIIALLAMLNMIGCASPTFERYAQNRQAEIAHMPTGRAKQQALIQLDADKKLDEQRKADASVDIAAGLGSALLFGIPGVLICGAITGANHAADGDFKKQKELQDRVKQYNQEYQPMAAATR